MKEKLKKLEMKKIFQEYNLLLVDDEYKKEMISEYRSDFLSKIEKLKSELGIINDIEPPKETEKNIDLPKKPKVDSNLIKN
jgi:hypothetical protein